MTLFKLELFVLTRRTRAFNYSMLFEWSLLMKSWYSKYEN